MIPDDGDPSPDLDLRPQHQRRRPGGWGMQKGFDLIKRCSREMPRFLRGGEHIPPGHEIMEREADLGHQRGAGGRPDPWDGLEQGRRLAVEERRDVPVGLGDLALEQVEASRVGVFTYLEPVFAASVAMIFLGERLTAPTAAGALLVFAGIYLSTRNKQLPNA